MLAMKRGSSEHAQNQHVEGTRWKSSISTHSFPMCYIFTKTCREVNSSVLKNYPCSGDLVYAQCAGKSRHG